MKQPGTLVGHADHQYLLVEGGFNAETRAVVLLARPDNPHFPRNDKVTSLRWGRQGDWVPIARWLAGELHIPDERHADQRETMTILMDAYRRKPVAPAIVAWATRRNGNYTGTLEVSLPMGFAAFCHERQEAAAALAAPGTSLNAARLSAAGGGAAAMGAGSATTEDGIGDASTETAAQVVPIQNLAMFFTHLVREGYAGAVWNGKQPVLFCVDDHQELQFMRIAPSPKGDAVVTEILDVTDKWISYEGAEELDFIENAEACDARLVACLGQQPVLGWPRDGRLFTVGPKFGVPVVISSGEEQDVVPHGVVFTSEAAANEFRAEAGAELTVFPVNDLEKFLSQSELKGCVAALNPGGHRAASGILWSDGEKLVLDSFSGFWKLDAAGFAAIA